MEKKVERVWTVKKVMKIKRGRLLGIWNFPSIADFTKVANRIIVETK